MFGKKYTKKSNDNDSALETLKNIREKDPSLRSWVAYVKEFKNNNYNQAIQIAKEVMPKNSKHNFNLGIMYKKLGQLDVAIQYFTNALKQDSFMIIAWFTRAVAYHTQNNLVNAVLDYTKTLELMLSGTQVDYTQLGLPFILSRHEVLYNRAVAFVGLDVLHRSREDLINCRRFIPNKNVERKRAVTDLLDQVSNQLAYATLNQVTIHRTFFDGPIHVTNQEESRTEYRHLLQSNEDAEHTQDEVTNFIKRLSNRPSREQLVEKGILKEQ